MEKKTKVLASLIIVIFLISTEVAESYLVEAQATSNQAPSIEWQKTYGSDYTVETSDLIQTSDGGYALMDLGYVYQNYLAPATIFKVDSEGDSQWNNTIAHFSGSSIIQTNDKGYEISGWWHLPDIASVVTATLIKIDTYGNIQWIQNYTTLPDLGVNYTIYGFGNQTGGSIQTSDSGSIYWANGNIVKTYADNNTQWIKTLTYHVIITNSSAPLLLTSVIETSDGAIAALGIAPAGYSTFPTQGTIYLVKLEPFLPVPSPSELPTPIPTATPYLPPNDRNAPHLELIDYFLPISVILAVAIVISLFIYRRHQKTI